MIECIFSVKDIWLKTPQLDEIIKVDKSIIELFHLKNKINQYFQLITTCTYIDLVLITLITLKHFMQMIRDVKEILGFAFCLIFFLIWIVFKWICNTKRPKKRNYVDIICGIRRMERISSIRKDRLLAESCVFLEYSELLKKYDNFVK